MADTLFYLSQIDNLRDPARNTRWRLLIPASIFAATGYSAHNSNSAPNLFKNEIATTDDFALHVKGCKIPEINLAMDQQDYMGFQSFFPVNAKLDGEISFDTILLEDMRAYEVVLAWHQNCINTGLLVNPSADDTSSAGADRTTLAGVNLGLGQHKDAESFIVKNTGIKVEMYNWKNGETILTVGFVNAYPTKVGGFDLTYGTGAKLVKFSFSLHYDRWTVAIPKGK